MRTSDDDDIAIIAAGIIVHESLKAADTLGDDGISARVIDCYSVKPLDLHTVRHLELLIITVEDHWPEGGLGDLYCRLWWMSRSIRVF